MASPSLRSFDYLEQLSENDFKLLYQQPSTALAIFRRFLIPLAKNFVMALLFLADPMPVMILRLWVKSESKREEESAFYILERLKILTVSLSHSQNATCYITNPFCTSLRQALTGIGDHRSFGTSANIGEVDRVPLSYLAEFATRQWEALLYFVVGSSAPGEAGPAQLSEGTKRLLREAEFVQGIGRSSITAKGFDFLLQEINTQIWSLLIEYIHLAGDQLGMNKVTVLSFLFTIGSLEIGQDYSKANMSVEEMEVLNDLHDFGLIYMPSDSDHFYPTPIATCITSDSSVGSQTNRVESKLGSLIGRQSGFIVIETNFRIYAYTSSTLQIEILNLFTKLSTRFPNMVAGRLTKESIQQAVGLGITAHQIITYLTAHAHSVMGERQRNSASGYVSAARLALPPTVVDQIRLWQIEGDRMKTTQGFLFRDFGNAKEYAEIARYADECGVLIWKSDAKQRFFASRTEQLSKFIANRNARMRENGNG